jgi:hypothetical protein
VERAARNQGEENNEESETSRSFVLSGNTSSAGSSTRLRVVRRDSGSAESNQRPAPREAVGEEPEDQGPTIAQIVVNRLTQNERRQRITAAFLRRLTSSRESTVQ